MQQPQSHDLIKNAMREINNLVQNESVDNTALVLWLSAFVPGFVASAIVAGFEYFDILEVPTLDEDGGDNNSEEKDSKSIEADNLGCPTAYEAILYELPGMHEGEGPKDGK